MSMSLCNRTVATIARLIFAAQPAIAGIELGPQVRVDGGGPAQAIEPSIAALLPNPENADIVHVAACWNDYRTGEVRLGVSISDDSGRTWHPSLVDFGDAIGDPFAFANLSEGTLWVGGSNGSTRVWILQKRPSAPKLLDPNHPVVVHKADGSCWRLSSRGLRVWAPRSGIGFSCRNQSSEAPIMRRPARHQQNEDQP